MLSICTYKTHRRSEQEKLTAVLLYISSLSLRTIDRLLKVSNVSVLNWVRKYALENYEKSILKGEAVIIELDMGKKQSFYPI